MTVTVKTKDGMQYSFLSTQSGDTYVIFGRQRGLLKGPVSAKTGEALKFQYYKERSDYSYGEEPSFVSTESVLEVFIQ